MHKPRRAGWGLSSGSYPIFWVRLFQPRLWCALAGGLWLLQERFGILPAGRRA